MPEWWQNSKASDLWASLLSEAYCSVHVHWYRFLCLRVMCVWDTVWRKCYCVQWCVYEVQSEGNVAVYSYVCLRYRVREMLLYTVMCQRYIMREMLLFTLMCVWGSRWGKCYCIHWCVSEVYGDGNVTFYNVVSLSYRVREILLFIMICVWGTEWGKCYCM